MTRFSVLLFCLFVVGSGPFPAWGAPVKARPFTGKGILIIRSFSSEQTNGIPLIILYRNPGVGRLREMPPASLPGLGQVLLPRTGEAAVAVLGTKGNWLRIAYDDAGREGWVTTARSWRYQPWDDYLKGRAARMLPGLKKGYGTLWSEPSDTSRLLETLTPRKNMRILRIVEDWAFVMVDSATPGWLRWRDEDGRFLIAIEEPVPSQNH